MEQIKDIVTTFFGGIWDLFTGYNVPLFDVPLSTIAVGFLMVRFSLLMISLVTGFRSNIGLASDQFRTSSENLNQYKKVRTQNENRAKIGGKIGF